MYHPIVSLSATIGWAGGPPPPLPAAPGLHHDCVPGAVGRGDLHVASRPSRPSRRCSLPWRPPPLDSADPASAGAPDASVAGAAGASPPASSAVGEAMVAAGASAGRAESRYGSASADVDSGDVDSGAGCPRERAGRPRRRGRRFSVMRGDIVVNTNAGARTAVPRPGRARSEHSDCFLRDKWSAASANRTRLRRAYLLRTCCKRTRRGALGASAFHATERHGARRVRNGITVTRGARRRSRSPRRRGGGGRVQSPGVRHAPSD